MDIGTLALVTQWVGTLLTFGLFLFLWQSMGSLLLRYWTLSWLSLAVSLLALTFAFRDFSVHVPLEAIYFFGEYCFAFFLIAGCRDIVAAKPIDRGMLLWLTAGAVAAVAWSLISDDFNLQFLPHAAIFAVCFLVAFRTLRPARRARRGSGITVMSLALLLLAIDFLHDVPLFAYAVNVGPERQPYYLHYNSIIDMVFEVLLGFGMVMVVLDALRQEVESANTQLAAALERLEVLARTDPLTNALNRHAYHALLGEPAESGQSMRGCVAIADLDRLKAINDEQGHAAGDAAIRKVATAIRSAIRADDLLFRWGGDEFLIVLWNVGEEEASHRFEPLDEVLQRDSSVALGVSFGFATFGDSRTLDQAIERADSLMYARKKQRAASMPSE